eukprot:GFYU01007868.1.p1 GENE.GFYU01007868.1~~GFYU01007868.1.p1  ORF type:complete len:199 (-),score=30.68 GFYU01007868.1:218-814(-)
MGCAPSIFKRKDKSIEQKVDAVDLTQSKVNMGNRKLMNQKLRELGLTEAQKAILTQEFKIFDKDHDGRIAWKEMIEINAVMGLNMPDIKLKRLFAHYDIDESGLMTLDEYMLFAGPYLKTPPGRDPASMKRLREDFSKYDTNCDGFVDADELTTIMEALGVAVTPEEIQKAIAKVDQDKNQKISFEEFVTWVDLLAAQ